MFSVREWVWGEGADTIGSPGPGHREWDCSGTAGTFPPALASFLRPAPAPLSGGRRSPREREQELALRNVWGSFPRPGAGVSAGGRHRDGKTSGLGVRDRREKAPSPGF